MITHLPGFQSFFVVVFLHHFVLAKFATSSIRVNPYMPRDLLDKLHLGLYSSENNFSTRNYNEFWKDGYNRLDSDEHLTVFFSLEIL